MAKQAEILHGQIISKRKDIYGNEVYDVATYNNEPSLTEQQFAEDADANTIMQRYIKNPLQDPFIRKNGIYADVSEVPDLAQALETVTKAQQAFDELPSDLRAQFGNSPIAMVEFLRNPKNRERALQLGLIEPEPKAPEPIKVEMVNPPQPSSTKS